MSNPLPLVLLASLVAGGAGAAATTLLTSPPAQTNAGGSLDRGNDAVLAKLESMEHSYEQLLQRIDDLESDALLAPVGFASERVSAVTPEAEIKEAVVAALAELDGTEGATTTPQLARAVEAVIEQRDERQKLEREQRRAEEEEKRLEDRLAKLQTDLGLDQTQLNSMRTIYQDQEVRRDGLRGEMMALRETGGSRDDMRAIYTGYRDQTNQAVQGVLTPSQYETYETKYANDRGNRFGRGNDNGGAGRGGDRNGGGRGGR